MKQLFIHFLSVVLCLGLLGSAATQTVAPASPVPAVPDPAAPGSADTLKSGHSPAPRQVLPETPSDSMPTGRVLLDTVVYTADKIEYDIYSKTLMLTGNGTVAYQGMVLYADTIHYVINDNNFVATGSPQLIDGADTVIGASMVYNIETRRGRVKYASAQSNDTRYNGEFIAKSDSGVYYMENADYTSCAHIDTPHYCFYGRMIKVLPGNKAIARPVVLNIGEAPVAALPYFILPMEHGRQSGLLRPSWGGHPGGGGYIENVGYYFAPNDYTDFTLSGAVREFQHYVLSARSNYKVKYRIDGYLAGRYTLSTEKDFLSKQWDIDYSHRQPLLPDQSMMLSGRGKVATSKFYQTFSEDTSELLNQKITADLNLSKQFKKINASMNLGWLRDQNLKNETVDENLPSLSFSLPQRPLIPYTPSTGGNSESTGDDMRWYNRVQYAYSSQALYKRRYSTADSLKDRMFAHGGLQNNASLSYNHTIFKYLNISPSINAQLSLFDATVDTTTRYRSVTALKRCTTTVVNPFTDLLLDSTGTEIDRRYIVQRQTIDTVRYNDTIPGLAVVPPSWNASLALSTNLYGVFPIAIAGLKGIRHTLSPSLSYTYTPQRELDTRYPAVVGYTGAQDRAQTVSLSVRNLFQGKAGGRQDATDNGTAKAAEKKFTIISGPDISASYNFEADKRPLSDISVSMSNPNPVIGINFSSRFTPYDEHDAYLRMPRLMEYSIGLNPKVLSARGSFWGGDLLVFDKLQSPDLTGGPPAHKAQSWSTSISPSYQFRRRRTSVSGDFVSEKTYQLSTSAQFSLSPRWNLSWSGRYDFNTNKFESNTLYFTCDLECWDMRFEWTPSGYNQGFRFNVGIRKHPDIKWEHRDFRRRY